MRMPFGKYEGQQLQKIPENYLRWVLGVENGMTPLLRQEIERILGLATEHGPSDNSDQPSLGTRLLDLIDSWRREQARRHHPDRGGNPDVLKAINGVADILIAEIKLAHE